MVCSSQGWPPKRGEGMCSASTEEQAGPSSCRDLWGPTQGHVQHAWLSGPSPLSRPYPLCQDNSSGQGLHERGKKKKKKKHTHTKKTLDFNITASSPHPNLILPPLWCPLSLSTKMIAGQMSKTKWYVHNLWLWLWLYDYTIDQHLNKWKHMFCFNGSSSSFL